MYLCKKPRCTHCYRPCLMDWKQKAFNTTVNMSIHCVCRLPVTKIKRSKTFSARRSSFVLAAGVVVQQEQLRHCTVPLHCLRVREPKDHWLQKFPQLNHLPAELQFTLLQLFSFSPFLPLPETQGLKITLHCKGKVREDGPKVASHLHFNLLWLQPSHQFLSYFCFSHTALTS